MGKIIKLCVSTALSGFVLLGMAADAHADSPHAISLGVEGFGYRYKEPNLMKDTGGLFGINADYFYNSPSGWLLGAEGRMDWGRADYKSYSTGQDKGVRQFLFEARALAGYTFRGTVNKSLFTGIGYRFKSDHSGGRRTNTGHHGYDRESNYVYLPIGGRLNADFNQSWDWQLTGEFDLLLYGKQKSYILYGYKPLEHKQTRGWGMKYDFLVGYKFGSNKISFGPFLNYWDIKRSKVVYGTVEPDNTTIEAGLKAKWTF